MEALEPLDNSSKDLFQLWTKILVSLPMRDFCSHLIKKDLVKWANKNFQEFRLDFSPESFRISQARIDFILNVMNYDYDEILKTIPNMYGFWFNRDLDIYFLEWDHEKKDFSKGDLGIHWSEGIGIFRT